MKIELEHTDLDQLLKEKLGAYKEMQTAEHWERFERNFSAKLISYRRFNRNLTAFYSGLAVAAVLSIILLIISIEHEISKNQMVLVQPVQKSSVHLRSNFRL